MVIAAFLLDISPILAAPVIQGPVAAHVINVYDGDTFTVERSEVTKAVAKALECAFGPAPLRIPLQEIVFKAAKPN